MPSPYRNLISESRANCQPPYLRSVSQASSADSSSPFIVRVWGTVTVDPTADVLPQFAGIHDAVAAGRRCFRAGNEDPAREAWNREGSVPDDAVVAPVRGPAGRMD